MIDRLVKIFTAILRERNSVSNLAEGVANDPVKKNLRSCKRMMKKRERQIEFLQVERLETEKEKKNGKNKWKRYFGPFLNLNQKPISQSLVLVVFFF